MCGRIRQAREPVDYIESMSWNPHDLGKLTDGLKYNVPPGTRPQEVTRIMDLGHATKIDTIEKALAALDHQLLLAVA